IHFTVRARTALAAVRQCPIASRLAIHGQLIVVSFRSRAAISAFFLSPLRRSALRSEDAAPGLCGRRGWPTNFTAACRPLPREIITPSAFAVALAPRRLEMLLPAGRVVAILAGFMAIQADLVPALRAPCRIDVLDSVAPGRQSSQRKNGRPLGCATHATGRGHHPGRSLRG
ncbi:MAG TPA: hypothetical protein VFV96_08050, partial [Verrucomicrobiae bacterium]|nr:hypothetical protein [Verrucomicrobiae bacterium]